MEKDIAKKKLRTQIKEKMEAIDNELVKEKYNVSVIENLAKEIEQINLKILRIKIDWKIKMRNILTLKQYQRNNRENNILESFLNIID